MPSSWKRRHLHRVIYLVSDPAFDKGYAFDFFCLEPMSHAPDDHHRPEGVISLR
ncbi:putative aldose 1-epimerase [Escherichia coli]|uniref:Putative aldose 1-epimerase n=1 Tax=Escherichia coli TaxID=562 RepID=A0A377DNG4_ECOLX|nr:putative aldose 1-epimerase [Escherichia coli]